MSIDPVFVNLCANEIVGNIQLTAKTIEDLQRHLVVESETLNESDMLRMLNNARATYLESLRQFAIVCDALKQIHRLTPEVIAAKVKELRHA